MIDDALISSLLCIASFGTFHVFNNFTENKETCLSKSLCLMLGGWKHLKFEMLRLPAKKQVFGKSSC